jgi:hypothetical protein
VSRLTLTCSDCHKIIFRLSTLVTAMITARVTRDLALPAPSRGGPVAVVGFQLSSRSLPPASMLDRLPIGALQPLPDQRRPEPVLGPLPADDGVAARELGVVEASFGLA